MRRLLLCALVTASIGCVTGAGEDPDDAAPVHHDGFIDDALLGDDSGDDAAPTDDTTPTPTDDAKPTDDASPSVDTGPADTLIFPPDDAGCTPSCTTCGASDGCGGTCKTGACGGGEACVAGTCVAPTKSHLSPGSYAFGSGWAKGITWSIGSEAPATIFYTLDGSTPDGSSASKPAPMDLFLSTSGTVIKWYADDGAKEPTIHSFTANIDTAGQSSYGFIVDKVNLSGKGPVVVVSPGATISGSADYQAWNSSGCPMCRFQLVYGIGTTSEGCLYDWSPGAWSGASGSGTISVKAPSSAGTYKLNVSYTLQTSCANGMATNPIGSRPTAEIATIVVK